MKPHFTIVVAQKLVFCGIVIKTLHIRKVVRTKSRFSSKDTVSILLLLFQETYSRFCDQILFQILSDLSMQRRIFLRKYQYIQKSAEYPRRGFLIDSWKIIESVFQFKQKDVVDVNLSDKHLGLFIAIKTVNGRSI